VFILREIEHAPVADVAAALEISEENVKIRLHRAKNMLKDTLREQLSALEIFPFHASRCALIASRVMRRIGQGRLVL
jgi:RNA polymerase sigma-70 factor (ECF subfamily)